MSTRNWKVGDTDHDNQCHEVLDESGRLVGTFKDYEDAQLAAGAPEMLELLRVAVEGYERNPHHIADGTHWNDWYNRAKATLAKATGGS